MENFRIKKVGEYRYEWDIPFGFEAKIENDTIILTKHWTVLDAKRGDIIANDECTVPSLHCLLCVAGGDVYASGSWYDSEDEEDPSGRFQRFCGEEDGSIDCIWAKWRPATDEERKTFFEQMTKAGYEWDEGLKRPVKKGEKYLTIKVEK